MANLSKIKIKGLRTVCGMTRKLTWGQHVQIFYDIDAGELFGIKHLNVNDRTVFHDDEIITVYDAYDKLTQIEIRDETYRRIRGYFSNHYGFPTKTASREKIQQWRRYGKYFEGNEERFSAAVKEAIETLDEGVPAADLFCI